MKNLKTKTIFLLLLFVVFSTSIFSQDLLITNEGDSLNCKITKIKKDNIYFTFKHKDEIRSTLLPSNQVKYYQYNFYQKAIVPSNKIVGNEIYPHLRIAINGGWSYRIARLADNIPSDFKPYMEDLKSGYHYGGDISYFFSEQLGFGFKYYNYLSKNEIEIYVNQANGTTQYGKMSDNISINFIGPSFSSRFLNQNKQNSFLLTLAIGYMGYKDDATLITDFSLKGGTLGLCWDIGYDIGLSKELSIGFQLSFLLGVLREYEFSDNVKTETIKLKESSYENLSRIDLSIGLRFNK